MINVGFDCLEGLASSSISFRRPRLSPTLSRRPRSPFNASFLRSVEFALFSLLLCNSFFSSSSFEFSFSTQEEMASSSSSLAGPSAEFALSLYDILKAETPATENIFFSPISISTVLSMTLLGASGKTAAELLRGLKYPHDFTHSQFGELITAFKAVDSNNVLLHVANRIFTRDGLNFLKEFTSGLSQHYAADAFAVNFGGDPNGSRLLINKWVEDQTKDKIKDLLPDGSIDSLTAAVLVNAVYFKGDWLNKFDPALTQPGEFKASPSQKFRVNFMFAKEKLPYGRNRDLGFHVLHLPYKGDELSMVVLLPFADDGLSALEAKLDAQVLLKAVKETRTIKVEVTMPKFKIEESIDLTDKLASMGIVDLFSDRADLSGVTKDVPLYVSKVFHKSFIEVNEEGAEAAAATGMVVMMRSMPAPPPRFTADHPFVFGIYDKRTEVFLFWGRIAHPTAVDAKDEL